MCFLIFDLILLSEEDITGWVAMKLQTLVNLFTPSPAPRGGIGQRPEPPAGAHSGKLK
jgi:hypothetical protein